MNYVLLKEFISDIERDLVERFDVPAAEAMKIAQYVEVASVQAEAKNRRDSQLILDFNQYGSRALAERYRVSDRTIREWRSSILRKKVGLVSVA